MEAPEHVSEQLVTERLLLRPLRPDDAARQRQMWIERDLRVPAHRRIGPDGRPTVEEIAADLRQTSSGPGLGLLAIELSASAEVVGWCGLVESSDATAADPEIAFELLRSAQGHGYATEAARAVVAWARAAGHPRLRATVWDWNAPSRRVLSRLGFTEAGSTGRASEHGVTLLAVLDL